MKICGGTEGIICGLFGTGCIIFGLFGTGWTIYGQGGLGTLPKKKNGKMWEFWKNRGGVCLSESHFHFLLFLTWETPQKKGPKMQNNP